MATSRKTVLITGASQGIGAATALVFAEAGYNTIINYRHDATGAEAIVSKCREAGVDSWAIHADMADESAVAELAAQVTKLVGTIDVLINNAAQVQEPGFDKLTKNDAITSFTSNIVTAILAIRAFVPDGMTPGGCVLSLSSIYGTNQGGNPKFPMYSASKAAIINLTQTLAKFYAPQIRFNSVSPGFTLTPGWESAPAERKKAVIESTLLKEWVAPDEIARTLLFLAETKHINAENIVVDGGWSKKDNH